MLGSRDVHDGIQNVTESANGRRRTAVGRTHTCVHFRLSDSTDSSSGNVISWRSRSMEPITESQDHPKGHWRIFSRGWILMESTGPRCFCLSLMFRLPGLILPVKLDHCFYSTIKETVQSSYESLSYILRNEISLTMFSLKLEASKTYQGQTDFWNVIGVK